MPPRRVVDALGILVLTLSASCAREAQTPDPIHGIPATHQRVIRRHELEWRWPFTVGTGTLGCVSGAVVFRTAGVSYAVNEAAEGLGFASIEPLRIALPSGPPRNPLEGVRQDVRMRIFAELRACDRTSGPTDAARACRGRIREREGLTEADSGQIEDEGEERGWPPLVRGKVSLDPLVQMGLTLCAP
jgi:hypothetical protein